jgi:hypothetical protein
MTYQTVNETAYRWGISPQRVRILCNKGRVPGAIKPCRDWFIPEGTPKPRSFKPHEIVKET